jgi:hypothetical protein
MGVGTILPMTMTLRALDQYGWRVETHGLIVEQAAGEDGKVMNPQVRRGVGDKREAGCVRFRKR